MQRTSWGLVFALWGAGLGAAAQYGKFSVIFHLLPDVYPDAGPALGFVVSVVGFVGILFGVVAGLWVVRIRYRRALIAALWVGAAVSVFQALLPPLPLLLASRIIEGLSHLALVVAAPTLISQLCAPKDRGFALTLWGTFFGVAFTILVWGGLPLVDQAGIPALMLAHAAYLGVFALILGRTLRALPVEDPPLAASPRRMLQDHLTIYSSARISAPAVGWLFYTFCFLGILTVLPPFIAPEQRALVIGAMPLVSIVVSMTLGVTLLRVLSAVGVVVLGFMGSAVTMLWLYIDPGDVLACFVLAGLLGLIQGASFAAVPQLNAMPAQQAQANGAMAQMGNVGNTLGTPVMAMVTASIGYAGIPILAGVVFICGGLAHLILARRRIAA